MCSSDLIQNNGSTNGITNPANYQVDLSVHQLDRNGATVKTYKFVDAFPSEIGDIQLGYDQGNAIETFNVVFQYNYWTSNTSTEAGSGFSLSGTINTPVGSFPI